MPKSSIEIRTPFARMVSSVEIAASLSFIMMLSVSSTISLDPGTPAASSAWKTVCANVGALNWIEETLTATPTGSGHRAASLHATRRTHSPIGTISPFSSASGIKSLGAMVPRTG